MSFRQNAPMGLGIAALALSGVALAIALGRSSGIEEIPLSIGSPPSLPPAFIKPCEGTEPFSDLGDLMAKRINGAVNRISFALHHDKREAPERMEDVANTAALLIGCVRTASAYNPEIGLEKMSDYYRSLDEMQDHALAVQVAALESDEVSARHWFTHLRQDCAGCHSRFRSSSGEDVANK